MLYMESSSASKAPRSREQRQGVEVEVGIKGTGRGPRWLGRIKGSLAPGAGRDLSDQLVWSPHFTGKESEI